MMALKEAKTAGHWLEGSPDIQALLSALAVRLQEQGRDFRKVLSNARLLKGMLSPRRAVIPRSERHPTWTDCRHADSCWTNLWAQLQLSCTAQYCTAQYRER